MSGFDFTNDYIRPNILLGGAAEVDIIADNNNWSAAPNVYLSNILNQ
jgi:hypothetical protein